jgi:hypothetical protein
LIELAVVESQWVFEDEPDQLVDLIAEQVLASGLFCGRMHFGLPPPAPIS